MNSLWILHSSATHSQENLGQIPHLYAYVPQLSNGELTTQGYNGDQVSQ